MSRCIEKTHWKVFAGVAIGVLLVWLLIGWYASTRDDPGKFGDMFGAVNALFTGLAFAGLIYANVLQREELSLQRQELAETRNEIKGQREQLETQSETFRLQLIESSFFQLLASHGVILNSIELTLSGGTRKVGRDCFDHFRIVLRNGLNHASKDANLNELTDQGIELAYRDFYSAYEKYVAHYFRSLYNLVKFVDKAEIGVEKKGFYANLVRAQLSSQELFILYFNGLSIHGREKLKPLIEKYHLLKHANAEEISQVGVPKNLYPVSAFQRVS